jgi:hypothetical protein
MRPFATVGVEERRPAALGSTVEAILAAFERADVEWCGVRIVEAVVVGGAVYRCDGRGGLCVVVAETCARRATTAEVAALREAIALGQVRIHARERRQFATVDVRVLHEATGEPLNADSPEARRWTRRLASLERVRQQGSATRGGAE